MTDKAKKNNGGRPSLYSEELAETICLELMRGKSLNEICKPDEMPAAETVMRWVYEDREGFSSKYARARDVQAERYGDEIIDLADTAEDVSKARLQIDTRKWVISKILPKKYGDKVALEHSGKDGAPIELVAVAEAARRKLTSALTDEDEDE